MHTKIALILAGIFLISIPALNQPVRGQQLAPLYSSSESEEDTESEISEVKSSSNKLSTEKISNHIKMASKLTNDVNSALSSDSKVKAKDKPSEFQDPSKHSSEAWLLEYLLKQYKETVDPEVHIEILHNLENYSHKYENGRDLFKATNALVEIILPALNSTNTEIRKAACGVLAIASQNNREVQEVIASSGVLRTLIQLVESMDQSANKALYALGSILRNYPLAQENLIKNGGLSCIVKAARLTETRRKVFHIISDMLSEADLCTRNRDSKTTCIDKKLLETSLESDGWCQMIDKSIKNLKGFDLYDQVLVVEAIDASLRYCFYDVLSNAEVLIELRQKLQDEELIEESIMLEKILNKLADHVKLDKNEL